MSAPHFRVGNSEHLAAEMVAHMRSTRASEPGCEWEGVGVTVAGGLFLTSAKLRVQYGVVILAPILHGFQTPGHRHVGWF